MVEENFEIWPDEMLQNGLSLLHATSCPINSFTKVHQYNMILLHASAQGGGILLTTGKQMNTATILSILWKMRDWLT